MGDPSSPSSPSSGAGRAGEESKKARVAAVAPPAASLAASAAAVENEVTLEPVVSKLERFVLYETLPYMYLVACDKLQSQYRLLKIDRCIVQPASLADICVEDPIVYSRGDMETMLDMIHEGNRATGGLRSVGSGFGIMGFVKFLDCYYLNLITQRKKVGSLGGNLVYAVKATELFPIKPDPAVSVPEGSNSSGAMESQPLNFDLTRHSHERAHQQHQHNPLLGMWSQVNRKLNPTPGEISEARYLGLFQLVDLTKDFYFSYTYDLTNSLQHNMTAATSKTFPPPPFKDMYAWNFYQTRELESLVGHLNSSFWVLPVVHGAFMQRVCNIFGRLLSLTLIGRRSRHFAGTRYLKRGVSDEGYVANDVEVEQIVHAESVKEGLFSSFLQMRGSIPTFWTQESSVTLPKPPIVLSRVDPTYAATQAHFADLLSRYGSPILVLDLVKQTEKREREVIVGREYRRAIEYINSTMPTEHKIGYCALDFSHLSKHRQMNVLQALEDVAQWTISQTGFFCSGHGVQAKSSSGHATTPALRSLASEQRGVLRTNCIDCLDRTNVAQFSIGVHALGKQMKAMGLTSSGQLDSGSQVVVVLMELYSGLGDQIALQYGGSEAHKKVGGGGAGGSAQQISSMNKHKELLTSIRRYYSNAFTDRVKQDAMNLFLGHFVPGEHDTPLWELDGDFYLHNTGVQRGTLQSMREFNKQQYFLEAEEDEEEEEEVRVGDSDASVVISRTRSATQALGTNVKEEREARMEAQKKRVRRLFTKQRANDSRWWKEALQKYAQQRMWMHLGPPKQGKLPSRFDRIHEPYRLTQFDKYFALDYAVPTSVVRDVTIMGRPLQVPKAQGRASGTESKNRLNLQDFASADSHNDRSLTIGRYVKEFARSMWRLGPMEHTDHDSHSHLGSPQTLPCADLENSNLGWFSDTHQQLLAVFDDEGEAKRREEFEECIRDFSLDMDSPTAASEVRRIVVNSHCSYVVQQGMYEGLPQVAPAKRTAAAVFERVAQLQMAHDRGVDESSFAPAQHLPAPLMSAVGLLRQIDEGLEHDRSTRELFSRSLDSEALGSTFSPLTTASAKDLYRSFDMDQSIDTTQAMTSPRRLRGARDVELSSHRFVQLDEDLYESADNQYLLFNARGVAASS
jgi:hypothetical protein